MVCKVSSAGLEWDVFVKKKEKQCRFRFGCRALVVAVTLACVALGWWAVEYGKIRERERAIVKIRQFGGRVLREYHRKEFGNVYVFNAEPPPGPVWFQSMVSHDYDVVVIDFSSSPVNFYVNVPDELLAQLSVLKTLEFVKLGMDTTISEDERRRLVTELRDVGIIARIRYIEVFDSDEREQLRRRAGLQRQASSNTKRELSHASCELLLGRRRRQRH